MTTSLLLGSVGAAVPIAVASALSTEQALELWAVLLAAVAAIYVGSALADGGWRPIVIEGSGGLVFVGMALAGLWASPWWLVGGWGIHAVWDLGHHRPSVKAACAHLAVEPYPVFCLTFDVVVAGAIALRFS